MSELASTVAVAASIVSGTAVAEPAKPTIVLVHGAFADLLSWTVSSRAFRSRDTRLSSVLRSHEKASLF